MAKESKVDKSNKTVRFKIPLPTINTKLETHYNEHPTPRTSMPINPKRCYSSIDNHDHDKYSAFSPKNIFYDINFLLRNSTEQSVNESSHYSKIVNLLSKFENLLKNALPKVESFSNTNTENTLQLNMLFYQIEHLHDESLQLNHATKVERKEIFTENIMNLDIKEKLIENLAQIENNSLKRSEIYQNCLKLCVDHMLEIKELITKQQIKPVTPKKRKSSISPVISVINTVNNIGNVNFNVNLNINSIQNITNMNANINNKKKKKGSIDSEVVRDSLPSTTPIGSKIDGKLDKREMLFKRVKTMRLTQQQQHSENNSFEKEKKNPLGDDSFEDIVDIRDNINENIRSIKIPTSKIKPVKKHCERTAPRRFNNILVTETNQHHPLSEEDNKSDKSMTRENDEQIVIYDLGKDAVAQSKKRPKNVIRLKKRSKTSFNPLNKLNLNNLYTKGIEMMPNSRRKPSNTNCAKQCIIY